MSLLPNFFKEPSYLSGYTEDSPILLGLSGGADSSALLHMLCEFSKSSNAMIFAAHVNHGIRTEEYDNEADRDEEFCRKLCSSLGVKLFVKRLDIPQMAAESGRGVEAEAREARYAFFSEIMSENNIKILATAHNADDNLETQIYNFSRGCGIDGLCGIPESRPLDSVDGGIVIRPILTAQKREIIKYCEEYSVSYVTDSTNLEDEYTRNAIRHKILPILEEMFPHIKKSAQRLSSSAKEDSDFILSSAEKIVNRNNGKISTAELANLHPALAKRVLMLMYKHISDATLEYVHVNSILSLLDTDKNGASISLPDRIRASVTDGYLRFEQEDRNKDEQIEYWQELSAGFNPISGTRFAVLISGTMPQNTLDGYSLYTKAKIKADAFIPLHVKNRQSGMTITDGGINKKIKKLMCDKKVPLRDRDTLPLVCFGNEIIYAPLCAIADKAKPHGNEKTTHIGIYQIIGG